ncbi:gliding motility-associated C-terminal domain-containing protein [Lewinella cohaerens]|uniref:T9SS type B sorting domain-containing protein n=1 Tax=Lewinella cohaerens TaxID=70995 RepID=UPI000372EAAE|nr:gliding motility-associated C-terminal domain-containing protein [Lewinella cohaerens]
MSKILPIVTSVFLVIGMLYSSLLHSQCENPTVALPDVSVPVDGDLDNAYCVTLTFNPALTGFPTGLSLDIQHTWQGDLALWIEVDGTYLNIFQRPGVLGSCTGGCPCGNSADLGTPGNPSTYTFSDGGGPDPENGMVLGGGDYGLTADDGCGLGTPGVTSFADLWTLFPPDEDITTNICISDHAGADSGVALDITYIFPNPVLCGCTDPDAINFDPNAIVDDGSCFYDCPDFMMTINEDMYEFCAGSNSFTMIATAPGATGASYSWSATNGGDSYLSNPFSLTTNVNIPPDFVGDIVYTLTVTDEFGCEDFVEVEVLVGEGPDVEITGDDFVCDTETTTLELIGGPFDDILWSTSSTADNINVGPGTYSVTVSDPAGCESVTDFTVEAFPNPEPTIFGPDEICDGDDAVLEVLEDFAAYEWSTVEFTQSIVVTDFGGYEVTVTDDNGCEGTTNFTLNVAAPVVVTISGDLDYCEGEGTTLIASNGFVSYEWSTTETFQDIYVDAPGPYSVTVIDDLGCEGTAEVEVEENPLPEPEIDGPEAVCPGETITLSVTENFAGYSWSTSFNTQSTPVDAAGIYTVTVTDGNGCEGETDFEVIEGEGVDAFVEGDLFFCPGESTELTITDGYDTYEWSNSLSGNEQFIDMEGDYTVTVTSVDGCTQILDFFVDELTPPSPSITGDLAICEGENTDLVVVGNYSGYEWSDGTTNFELNVDETDTYSVTVTDDNGCEGETSVDVVVNIPVELEIDGPDALCNNAFGQVSISGSFMNVQWIGGPSTNIYDIVGPGLYEVEVIDQNGCEAFASIDIPEGEAEPIDIVGDTQICSDGDGQLMASAGYDSYLWSNNETTQTITVTSPGNYWVIGTDGDGCESFLDIDVTEVPSPTPAIAGDLTVCPGSTTVLTADSGYNNYSWTVSGSTNEVTGVGPGIVTVTVTDAIGCTGESSVEVVEVPNPTPVISGDLVLCEDEISTLSLDQPYTSYLWSDTSTDPTLDVMDGTTFGVTVTDAEGCMGSTSVTLEEIIPTVAITGDLDFCFGETTTLSVPDNFSSYAWSTGGTTNTVTTSGMMDVSVTVTDENGCTATDTVSLTEFPLPTVEITGRLSFCPAGGTNLTATEGYVSYLWSNMETTSTIFLNQAGTYTVTVTDANGCQNTASATIIEDSELDPIINGDPFYCAGLNTTLTVPDDFSTYEWSNSAQVNEISVSTPGMYTVTVADEFGCMGTATVDVVELALPTPAISGDLDYCIGDSTTLNGGNGYASYAWSVAGDTDQFLVVDNPGNYGLTVTDDNGCIGMTSAAVVQNALPVTTILGEPGYCPGLTTVLTAEPGFVSYLWSTNTSGTSIEVGTTETFSLSVTDANGCVGVATQAVEEYVTAIPDISGEPQFCPGESTDLSAEAGFVSYNWSNGANEADVTITQTGNISLVVTDGNGCVTNNSIDLSNFIVTAPMITAPVGFCSGLTADLSATPGYAEYLWSNSAQTADITVNTGGIYELDVIDNNGCPSEAAINIQQYALPTPEIGGSLTFCIGNSTQLNAGATYSTYSWSDGSDQPEVTVNTPGNVGLTVTDANGCIGNTVEFVNEATELSPVISGARDYCIGSSTTLSAGTGFATYMWSNGETTNSIIVDEPGTYTLNVTDAGGCEGTAMVDVIENALPTPAITGDLDYCAGLSTQLSATPGYVNYTWSTSAPTTMITVNTPGAYSVTVEDDNGCINETSTTVIEQALPVFSIVGPTNFCVDSFTQLNVQPAFAAYDWSVGSDQQSVQVSTGGTVGVTVTDSNGCISSGAQAVATVPLPLADAGSPQDLDCDVLEVSIGGNGSTTGNQFTYQWTGPGITPANEDMFSPTVGEPGTYSLQVTNETYGCLSVPAEVEITDLAYTPQIVLEVLDILDCATATVQIDARDSDGGPQFVYQWYDGDLNPIPGGNTLLLDVNEAQFYTLSIIDTLTGCDNTDMIEVTENELYPVAEAGLAQLITCGEPVVTLNGSDSQMGGQITYDWTTPDGSIVGNNNNIVASANQPGWYYLLVTDEQNGCANIDSVFVSQNTTLPTAQTSDDFELDCNFPTTSLSGAGSSIGGTYAYQWLLNGNPVNDATSLQLTAEAPGTYTLIVTDTENDCTAQDVVEISLNPAQPEALNFITDTPTCAGDDDGGIILTGVQGGIPPYTYSVGGAPYGTTTSFNDLIAGDYEVIVEDATGCLLLTTITVPDGNDLTLELGPDQYITEGELADIYPEISVDTAALVSIDWQTLANLPCPGCVYQLDLALEESTQFFLDLEDENGCTTRDLLTIFVKKDRNIYVPNAFSPDGNGDNDIFYIFSDDSVEEIRSFLVFNRWGESVFEVYGSQPNDPRWGWDGSYRGQPVNAAVYVWFAEIEFKNGDVEIIKGDVVIMR